MRYKNKKKFIYVVALGLISAMAVTACGAQSGDTASSNASNLNSVSETKEAIEVSKTNEKSENTVNVETEESLATYEDAIALLDEVEIPEGETLSIGYLAMCESIQYCADVSTYIVKTIEEFGDKITLNMVDGRGDASVQISQAEDMITLGVDAVIISVIDRDTCVPAIDKMMNAGIPVIVLEGPDVENCTAKTGYDFIDISVAQVEMIADAIDGKGVINIVEGQLGSPSSEYGVTGIEKGLENYPEITIGTSQAGDWDRGKAMNIAEDWLSSNMEFDAIIALNDEMAIPVANVLKSAGKSIPVVGIDCQDETAEFIKQGVLYGSIYKNPMYEGVSSAALAIAAACEMEIEESYYVPYTKVTAENADNYKS